VIRNVWYALLEIKWAAILALLFMAGALAVAFFIPTNLTMVLALGTAGIIWAILYLRQ
jgi:hypothetical protein